MMKVLLSVVLGAAAQWVSGAWGDAAIVRVGSAGLCSQSRGAPDKAPAWSADADGKTMVFVTRGDGEGEGEVRRHVVRVDSDRGEGERTIEAHAVVLATTDAEVEGREKQVRWIARVGEGDDESHGWLGVSIGKVDAALADQLDVRDRGVLVLNVIKDSPAERAGIGAHDIILSVDGEVVSGEVAKVVELIGGHKPGDEIDVLVLRDGQEQTVPVVLGSRADMVTLEWRFDVGPQAEIEEKIVTRGKVLSRDDEGNWVFKDLADLEDLSDLGAKIKELLPRGKKRCTQVFVDGNRSSVRVEVKEGDSTVLIDQADEGSITVTRTDAHGEQVAKTYENEAALREGDPDAYALFERAGDPVSVRIDLKNLPGAEDMQFDYELDLESLGDTLENVFKWHGDFDEGFGEASEAYRRAMEQARDAYERAMAQVPEAYRQAMESAFGQQWNDGRSEPGAFEHAAAVPFAGQTNKPKHVFTTRENGSIEVRIRREDSELVREYSGAEDLRRRDPDLHKKYEELLAADTE